ncbi:MAG TPA: SBBP repeat-containing protein [Pyrinomonadaceae bacterium]|jgi:hypothetical protein
MSLRRSVHGNSILTALLLISLVSGWPFHHRLSLASTKAPGIAVQGTPKSDQTKFLSPGKSGGLSKEDIDRKLAGIPLSFEPFNGSDSQSAFLSRGVGYNLLLTPSKAVFTLKRPQESSTNTRPQESAAANQQSKPLAEQGERSFVLDTIEMKLTGANKSAASIEARDELQGRVNYFLGNDARKWRTDIRTYAKVICKEVYPGVDLAYHGNQQSLEYDFILAPSAKPEDIGLKVDGIRSLKIDAEGALIASYAGGQLRQSKPVAYQEVDGRTVKVAVSYLLKSETEFGFRVGAYDRTRQLIIDPVLLYSTYIGGTGADDGYAVAANSSSVFISGTTFSANPIFPATPGAYQTMNRGRNAFVAKLNNTTSTPSFDYITYLGGTGGENGYGIAADETGNAYVVGWTGSSNFPTTPLAFRRTDYGAPGFVDGFVTKLNPSGSALVYSTYLGGGEGYDYARDIVVDAFGQAYITGDTTSVDFPRDEEGVVRTTPGGFAPHFTTLADPPDAFALALSADGSNVTYTTLLGGDRADIGYGITLARGGVCVTGETRSNNFPIATPLSATLRGASDAFVSRLDFSFNMVRLPYSTYLGGDMDEQGRDIAADTSGLLYITGSTNSNNFPTRFPIGIYSGGSCGSPARPCFDSFVTKLDLFSSGAASLIYSTYLGGANDERGNGIFVDASGKIYLTGETFSNNFAVVGFIPRRSGPLKGEYSGEGDAYVVKLQPVSNSYEFVYSAYLGEFYDALTHIRLSREYGSGIVADAGGNAFVTGQTSSNRFAFGPAPFTSYGGNGDAFLAKIGGHILDSVHFMMLELSQLTQKSGFNKGVAAGLTAKLAEIDDQFLKGNLKVAAVQLQAFIKHVHVLAQKQDIDPAQEKLLVGKAEAIITLISQAEK